MSPHVLDVISGQVTVPLSFSTEPKKEEEVEIVTLENGKEIQTTTSTIENKFWRFYTLDTESKKCPFDCLLIANAVKYLKHDNNLIISVKTVKDASCSPNGQMPIFVNEQDGSVHFFDQILTDVFDLKLDINQSLILKYIRSKQSESTLYGKFNIKRFFKKQFNFFFKSDDYDQDREDAHLLETNVLKYIKDLNNEIDYESTRPDINPNSVLTFSIIQGIKTSLNYEDPVRTALEESCEHLNEFFISFLQLQPQKI